MNFEELPSLSPTELELLQCSEERNGWEQELRSCEWDMRNIDARIIWALEAGEFERLQQFLEDRETLPMRLGTTPLQLLLARLAAARAGVRDLESDRERSLEEVLRATSPAQLRAEIEACERLIGELLAGGSCTGGPVVRSWWSALDTQDVADD